MQNNIQTPFARMLLTLAALCGLALMVPAVSAEAIAPDAQVKTVTEEVLDIIRKDKEIQSGNSKKAQELIEAKVLPHFDFERMTALAVGREWRTATPEQKKSLSEEFRVLLVRTYANALTAYKSQTIDYKPFKMKADETDVLVRTEVKQPGSKSVGIDYSLIKKDDAWKVYDVVVSGVSLVTSYRDQFKQELSAGGLDGLLKTLQVKNQTLAANDNKGAAKK